jgi:single-stranded DNA-binding protein
MFDKGTRVIVSGQLNQRSYEHEGATRVNLEIKNATVGIVHRFNANKTETASATNDDWAVPPSDDVAPF